MINSYSHSYFLKSNVSIASVRAGNVIGGGDWSNYRLIPDIIRAHKNNVQLDIRNPKAVRPWQHVLEPLFGYLTLAKKLYLNKSNYSGSWNFGPEKNDIKTVSEVIKIAKDEGMELIYSNNNKNKFYESKFLSLDISKAKKLLLWNPKWKSEMAIKKTIQWYIDFYNKKSVEQLMENDIKSYLKNE